MTWKAVDAAGPQIERIFFHVARCTPLTNPTSVAREAVALAGLAVADALVAALGVGVARVRERGARRVDHEGVLLGRAVGVDGRAVDVTKSEPSRILVNGLPEWGFTVAEALGLPRDTVKLNVKNDPFPRLLHPLMIRP